jgi:hypothetical protein
MTNTPQKSWFQRNKLWFLPTVIGGPLLIIGTFVFMLLTLIMTVVKSSGAYELTVETIHNDPRCQALLGDNMEEAWFVMGNVETHNYSGTADLTINMEGDKGEGRVYSYSEKTWGDWEIYGLKLETKDTTLILIDDF